MFLSEYQLKQGEENMNNSMYPILIADDDTVIQKILVRILSKSGYEVNIAVNGKDALDKLSKKFYPIVITDWDMPEMNGLELCKHIRKNEYEGYVYILFLSSNDSKQDIIQGLKAGANEYLSKPINPLELITRISTAKRIINLERSLRKKNEEIKYLSIIDPLTKAFNRGYLDERMVIELKRGNRYKHPLSIILCDIDFFKKVNDTYGHQAGDEVLKRFVGLIITSIRSDLDFVVRFGGEEFLIVLPETSIEAAVLVAERIRKTTEEDVVLFDNNEIKFTASFGLTCYESDNVIIPEFEGLISEADANLYKSKETGRNKITGPPEKK